MYLFLTSSNCTSCPLSIFSDKDTEPLDKPTANPTTSAIPAEIAAIASTQQHVQTRFLFFSSSFGMYLIEVELFSAISAL